MSVVDDLRSLDFEDPGGWPLPYKIVAAAAVAVVILVAGYTFKIKEEQEILERKRQEQTTLFQEFERKHQKSAKLEEYKAQLAEMEEILRSLLRQLPSKTEMPDLLQSVSQTAIGTGIQIDRFRPETEIVKDFYAEKPISLRMQGGYHQFGNFVSGVASLARVVILTMHDISLRPVEEGSSQLVLEGTVKTYRYLDEEEEAQQSQQQQARGRQ